MKNEPNASKDTKVISDLAISLIVALGLLLIVLSIMIPLEGIPGYFHELLKELGIVLFSVFAVSWIYERLITKKLLSPNQSMTESGLSPLGGKLISCTGRLQPIKPFVIFCKRKFPSFLSSVSPDPTIAGRSFGKSERPRI